MYLREVGADKGGTKPSNLRQDLNEHHRVELLVCNVEAYNSMHVIDGDIEMDYLMLCEVLVDSHILTAPARGLLPLNRSM